MTIEWTAPPVERVEAERICGERAALQQWLDYHRATLLMKCAGLTATQLKERATPPSTLSLLGLVRHMTEVERGWFRVHAAGEDLEFPYDPDGIGLDFDDLDDADPRTTCGRTGRRSRPPARPWRPRVSTRSCPAAVTTPNAPATSAGSTCT